METTSSFSLSSIKRLVLVILLLIGFLNSKAQIYTVSLSGPNESPPNASPATGNATITINTAANTMRVRCTFSGLTGTTTASHIHAATTTAGTGTAGVATTIPSLQGFPLGVTSGSYDNTLDMTLSSCYSPAYITANGGTTASAFAALQAAIAAGKSYLNIHTAANTGGEIRAQIVTSDKIAFDAWMDNASETPTVVVNPLTAGITSLKLNTTFCYFKIT